MDKYIEKFIQGSQAINVVRPVTQGDLSPSRPYSEAYRLKKCMKFIPASGAATRMFKDLYAYLDAIVTTDYMKDFFLNIKRFPFYDALEKEVGYSSIETTSLEGRVAIVKALLDKGLRYGQMPKALLRVHSYGHEKRTPIEEHIYEGHHYLNPDHVDLHFTISKAHESIFKTYIEGLVQGQDKVKMTYSFQKTSTDTLAVDLDNTPFLQENGQPLYRAGGHGALIENLNDVDADIIFIKNIDNVCHQSQASKTIESKKVLASLGLEVKSQIDTFLDQLQGGQYDLQAMGSFIEETLHIKSKTPLTPLRARMFLDRPLRVCGLVKNQGQAGGGPFLVDHGDYIDLQICEKAELNLKDPRVAEIFEASAYFNPVDLVCFVKDNKGKKYDLRQYVNQDRYFISEKTYQGRPLKALEHPGLWNGGMDKWNTLFVEVSLETFNPIKTVNDLLKPGHLHT